MTSSADSAIHLANLSKLYKVYNRPADMVWELVSGRPLYKPFWALQDISFDVQRGQVVGLIGRNGAGKSTLLKIIAGTLDASSGEIQVNGRISSILELGTGFNPQYSGRENIYMGGLIAGLSSEEIKEKEDWVIEFSELREFIDQPFRTYSSGMQARLTFSTAVCIDPDILIIDEALSVGDARFQRKSFGKIEEFRKVGKTILFVSHDMNSIRGICDMAILLEKGKILEVGKPDPIAKKYWKILYVDQNPRQDGKTPESAADGGKPETKEKQSLVPLSSPVNNPRLLRAGSREGAEVLDIGILDSEGERVTVLESGEKYSIFIKAFFKEDIEDVRFGFHIVNEKGVVMYGISTSEAGIQIPPQKKGQILEARLNVTMWLTNGTYLLSGGVGIEATPLDFLYDALVLTIPRLPGIQHASVVNLQPEFEFANTTP
ncbi:MAG TPA: ABC transporter ATP-binding protein [Anaerolineales bacterium]|nr:ABC transporter ATP-binding protein [Anaerolineales bacterium]